MDTYHDIMSYFLIIAAALSVSLDAMLTGFALGLQNRRNPFMLVYITLINFLTCLLLAFLGDFVRSEYAGIIGGVILIVIGLKNCFSLKKSDGNLSINRFSLIDITLLSLGLSIDNAIAALSFSFLTDMSIFIVPVVFTAASFLLLSLGTMLSRFPLQRVTKKLFWLPGFVLSCLGCYKIITCIVDLIMI